MSDNDDTNYFARAAEHWFRNRKNAALNSSASSSYSPEAKTSQHVSPRKVTNDCIGSDDKGADSRQASTNGKKRQLSLSSTHLPVKRSSYSSTTTKQSTSQAFLSFTETTSEDVLFPPSSLTPELPTSSSLNPTEPSCFTVADYEILQKVSKEKHSSIQLTGQTSSSRSVMPAITLKSTGSLTRGSVNESVPLFSTLFGMPGNKFTSSQETVMKLKNTLPISLTHIAAIDENAVYDNLDNLDHKKAYDSDVDNDFEYNEDNDIVFFESSDDEIQIVYESPNEAIKPMSSQVKSEQAFLDEDNEDVYQSSEDEDDDATIVISDSDENEDNENDSDDDSESSTRSNTHYIYDDPRYDFINPLLNEHFSTSGADAKEILNTFFTSLITRDQYAKLFGNCSVNKVILEVQGYMAATRAHYRAIRLSRKLQKLVENEQVDEPWLPNNKATCLQLFSADPSVKPEFPKLNQKNIDEV